jgi:hypothetical protein
MERRSLLQLMLKLGAAGALAPIQFANAITAIEPIVSDKSREFLQLICDLIIPDTDSPGAIKAGVLERFDFVLAHMTESEKTYWLEQLADVQAELNAFAKNEFISLPKSQQTEILSEFDKMAYQSPSETKPNYRQLKQEIGAAYYTTEAGMTQELRYMPVPGKWEACIPLSEVGRTWAK